jgi:hypothetical protein
MCMDTRIKRVLPDRQIERFVTKRHVNEATDLG